MYKKTFVAGELVRSSEHNENFTTIQSSMHFIDATFLTGQINGVTTVFTTMYPYITGSIEVFVDGMVLTRIADFTETSSQSFTILGTALITSTYGYQSLSAKYIRSDI